MATAPLVAGWQRGRRSSAPWPSHATSTAPPDFPREPLNLRVELYLAGAWVDVSGYVYQRDSIVIRRGKSSEASTADPATCSLTFDNRDGRFSPRNPSGAWYGLLGRNTPLRVLVGTDPRFTGRVASWPVAWDTSGSDVWASVQAAGELRRMSQGASSLRSALYRAATGTFASLRAYWPAEDGDTATVLSSGVENGTAMMINGSPDLASVAPVVATDALPTVNLSRWVGDIPAYTPPAGGDVELRAMVYNATAQATGVVWLRIYTGGGGVTGLVDRWDITYTTAAGGTLTLRAYDGVGTVLHTSSAVNASLDGRPKYLILRLEMSGSDTLYDFYAYDLTAGTSIGTSGTVAGALIARASRVEVSPDFTVDDVVIGHISVQSTTSLSAGIIGQTLTDQLAAHAGERAGTRMTRLAAEEGLPFSLIGYATDTPAMGAQGSATLLELLTECATADLGLLYEPRDALGLAYRTRATLYNRPTRLTLDYAAHQMSALLPVEDDQLVVNDITVTRSRGSSYRATLDAGALSTADPPNGVGRYDGGVTLNLNADADLPDQAGWRLHLGTVDEPRYPSIPLNLASPALASKPLLAELVAALDVGDRLDVVNPPAWLAQETIAQAVLGVAETLNTYERTVEVNCAPESPWRVAVYDGAPGPAVGTDPSFESGTNGANPGSFFGGPAPTVAVSALHPTTGSQSLEITWAAGGQGQVGFVVTGLVPGYQYTIKADVWTASGAPDLIWFISGDQVNGFGPTYSTKDATFTVSVTVVAMATTAELWLADSTPGGAGLKAYLDTIRVSGGPVAARYSPDGSTLAVDPGSTSGELSVATAAGPLWTTADGAFDVLVGGERMTVVDVNGSSSPQQFIVARSVNGVTKSHPAGTAVELADPAYYGF